MGTVPETDVAYKKADYAHALSRSDTDVQMYLFETFGGWCNAVKRLFYQMKDKVRNKLSKRQHEDEASWSTRLSRGRVTAPNPRRIEKGT